MSTSYDALIKKVLAWSNRDAAVFGITEEPSIYTETTAGLLGDFVQYSADKAYRSLRVPSLELSRIFEVTEDDYEDNPANYGVTTINIPVPHDLIDVIYIRNKTDGYTFDEKVDLRTFYNNCSEKTTRTFWTRDGNVFKVAGVRLSPRREAVAQVGEEGDDNYVAPVEKADGTMLEIHYYRRLPAMFARYNVTAATYNADTSGVALTLVDPQPSVVPVAATTNYLWFPTGTTISNYTEGGRMALDGPRAAIVDDVDTEDIDESEPAYTVALQFSGEEADHWLRDQNERIVLFGALAEAFAYLAEDDQAAKYLQIWQTEIDELNREETMRQTKGGNIKINYDGFGMI